MTMTMRTQLVSALAQHMRNLAEFDAKRLAHELTVHVNDALAGKGSTKAGAGRPLACFPPETWSQLTVGVPWEGYARAHGGLRDEMTVSSVKAVCSAPAGLDDLLASKAGGTGLWGGSLLVALGQMLAQARRELIVFAPYWRSDGVKSLLSAGGRACYDGVQVKVFTQPAARMASDDRHGVNCFADTLNDAGAQVTVLAPRQLTGAWPFIHAKLMIADGARAYVGSANFTSSGLDHGIESGVMVEGEVARSFAKWAQALGAGCVGWQE